MAAKNKTTADTQKAVGLFQQGRLSEAQQLLESVCATRRALPVSWFLLAAIHATQGDAHSAEAAYREAIRIKPDYAEAYNNLGVLHDQQNRREEAARCFHTAISLNPAYANAHFSLGNLLQRTGNDRLAEHHYRKATTLNPNYANAFCNLGVLLQKRHAYSESRLALEKALELQPGDVEILTNLGYTLQACGKVDEAISHYEHAIRLRPDLAEAWNNLGMVHDEQGRHSAAAQAFQRALALKPDYAEAMSNLGHVYHNLKRYDQAVHWYRNAIQCRVNYLNAYDSLSVTYKTLGDWQASNAVLQQALAIDPLHKETRYHHALNALTLGDFKIGWHHYRLRPSMWSEDAPGVPELLYDLRDKRILIERNQGLGDELFFLRFAPALKQRGAHLTYLSSAKIASILARVSAIDSVITKRSNTDGPFNARISVADLPLLLSIDREDKIPPPLEFSILPERLEAMRSTLKELGPPPYIGVTWRAGTRAQHRLFKDIPVEELTVALRDTKATFLVLQRDPAEGEIARFGAALDREIYDMTGLNEKLEDMLALLSLLDDYVGVSNTNIHLRAGTHRSSRVLVPHPPDWRWMAHGDHSPWFPDVRIYRQDPDESWKAALCRLSDDLLAQE